MQRHMGHLTCNIENTVVECKEDVVLFVKESLGRYAAAMGGVSSSVDVVISLLGIFCP